MIRWAIYPNRIPPEMGRRAPGGQDLPLDFPSSLPHRSMLVRWLAENLEWSDAVTVSVDADVAAAGYRVGYRIGGEEGDCFASVPEVHMRAFYLPLSRHVWTLFLLDAKGEFISPDKYRLGGERVPLLSSSLENHGPLSEFALD